jgi:uncharacterized protein YqhQ
MKNKKHNSELACRRGKVGGQAVLDGVMMRCGEDYSIASRLPDGSIKLQNHKFRSLRKKNKFFNIPILRGVVSFIESMVLSFKTLSQSADALGLEEEETKFEKWLKNKFGKSIVDFIMVIASVLGVGLGIGLFFFLPMLTARGIEMLCALISGNPEFLLPNFLKTVIEGLLKIVIFFLYVWLVSFMSDIRRTYEYHGAEHKSIACYEAGEELTPENAKKYTRFHPRCGTSFIFVMLIISILVYMFVPWGQLGIRFALKLALMPVIMGVGFEFLMWAGKCDNVIVRAMSAPGLWMQRITTREPSEEQLEIAIAAIKACMPDEFPVDHEETTAESSACENEEN